MRIRRKQDRFFQVFFFFFLSRGRGKRRRQNRLLHRSKGGMGQEGGGAVDSPAWAYVRSPLSSHKDLTLKVVDTLQKNHHHPAVCEVPASWGHRLEMLWVPAASLPGTTALPRPPLHASGLPWPWEVENSAGARWEASRQVRTPVQSLHPKPADSLVCTPGGVWWCWLKPGPGSQLQACPIPRAAGIPRVSGR